jgi:prepilin-type N-terminal cleavage/methylation domain-containing protein
MVSVDLEPRRLMEHPRSIHRNGFTIVEILATLGIIAILLAITLAAMQGLGSSGITAKSHHNLRQIHTWMELYTGSNRDTVLPSQFDYTDENRGLGSVRSGLAWTGDQSNKSWMTEGHRYDGSAPRTVHVGTWADILWFENALNEELGMMDFTLGEEEWGGQLGVHRSYRFDSPDRDLYDQHLNTKENPLRSAGANTWDYPRWNQDGSAASHPPSQLGSQDDNNGLPTPYGGGAWERELPGFFAANNFFDGRSDSDLCRCYGSHSQIDRLWTSGQILDPSRSMYIVDSFAGEVIGHRRDDSGAINDAMIAAFHNDDPYTDAGGGGSEVSTCEVDFRYGGNSCLMLMLDGHVQSQSKWGDIWDLEGLDLDGPGGDAMIPGRGIRIMDLDRRQPLASP